MINLHRKVKANLYLEHSHDDALLQSFIVASVNYAESFQHIPTGTYTTNLMSPTTEQAVIMLASHFYEHRGNTIGDFYTACLQTKQQIWDTINMLLWLDRN